MGRPPLKLKDPTVKTTIRLPASLLKRLKEAIGEGGVSDYLRELAEADLTRRERAAKRKPEPET